MEEWLLQIVDGQERALYERTTDERGKVTVDARGVRGEVKNSRRSPPSEHRRISLFSQPFGRTIDRSELSGEIGDVLNWFEEDLILIAPHTPVGSLAKVLQANPDLTRFAGDFLKSSSTGVGHLQVDQAEIDEDELRRSLPDYVVRQAMDPSAQPANGPLVFASGDGNVELVVEKGHFYRLSVWAAHATQAGTSIPLDLTQESDGTRRLLNLIPALHELQKRDVTYFVDEIDRSMHPILVRNFLDFFLKSSSGPRQLIVTTHESNLLDLDLLRRDEIWFAEKDRAGATRLYSLVDFEIRKDSEIKEHYLQGRFGAIPFLGDLDRLREAEPQPK